MRRQRNMAQIKEQIQTPEKELNKMEISNLSDAEFKTLVVRMFKELSENFNNLNKNNLQGNNSRVYEAENQFNHLEHTAEKTTNENNKNKKYIV